MPFKSPSSPSPSSSSSSSPFNTTRAFFFFIFLFALLSFFFLFLNFSATRPLVDKQPRSPPQAVRVLMWDVKESKESKYSSFLGEELNHGTVTRQCPYECTFTTDRSDLHLADAVMFDPTSFDYDNWRRLPISLPHKQPYQLWIMTSYQHHHNYPLVTQPTYRSFMDMTMTYEQSSNIPISLFCPWGTSFKGPDDLLKTTNKNRKKSIMFLSSNCQFSGASARTSYVEELMKYIDIDSYGDCLHNKDWDEGGKRGSSFQKMEEKIKLMSQYKIVLAFENNNVTDYVTETLFNVYQSGALPIYMGAPNIDDWTPGTDTLVKTSDFDSPAALATYLKQLLEDDKEYNEYFKWKKGKISKKFKEKYDRCMFSSQCRVCQSVWENLPQDAAQMKRELDRPTALYQSVRFNGQGDAVRIPHHNKLCVTNRYTLMAWVKPASFGDQRVIDKNRAGTISGYNFDIQADQRTGVQGFLRLCAGDGCYMSKKGIFKDTWSHIAVVYSSEHPSVFENHIDFYINGVLDTSEIVFAPTKQETNYPLTFGKPSNEKDTPLGFHGSMDNLAIFSHDLTGAEIRKYMFSIPREDEKHMVGFWSFDDPPDEDYVHDLSLNEYDGQLAGATREPSIEKPLHMNKCH